MLPLLGPLGTFAIKKLAKHAIKTSVTGMVAKHVVSKAVEKQAMAEAVSQSDELAKELRITVYLTILWQNAALLLAIGVSYWLGNGYPFYVTYALVFLYSLRSVYLNREYLFSLARNRSLFKVVQTEVLRLVRERMLALGTIERFVLDHLGPDLDQLSHKVAQRVYPGVKALLINLCFTLLLSFVVFRVWLVPTLAKGIG